MPRHMSSRERIERMAAEKAAAMREKEEAKRTKAANPAPPRARSGGRKPAAPKRMKVVWGVGEHGQPVVRTFPYPQKPAAEAEAARLSSQTGRVHVVRPEKVPMEE